MTPSQITFLTERGVNHIDAMERFAGNEKLFLKLLGMFSDDSSMDALIEAMSCGNWEQAERSAHSLKGVAGNLSFERLYHEAAAISKALREGNVSEAERHLPEARQAYEKAKEAANEVRLG